MSLTNYGQQLGDLVNQGITRSNAAYDKANLVADEQLGLARKNTADYDQYLRPFIAQQADYVNKLGSPEYAAQQRAQAMELSQAQAESAWEQQRRRALGLGANVNSGAFAAGSANWAAEAAKAKVAAAMKSDSDIFGKWSQGLTDTNNFGLALQKQAGTNSAAALDWSKYGTDASKNGFGMALDAGKLANANAAVANQATRNANDYALGQKSSDRADDAANPWTTLGGAFLGAVAKPIAGKMGDYFSGLFTDGG